MNIPYTISANGVVAHVTSDGFTKPYMALPDHRNFAKIKEMLLGNSEDVYALSRLFDVTEAIKSWFGGKITIEHGVVKYNGAAVHNHVTQEILKFMDQGLTPTPIINFLGKLMLNPSWRAREELFTFREHKNMPLTPAGFFQAYKGVRPDYNDKYSNTICNKVGESPRMPREQVCDDSNIGCGPGFHAGSLAYASDWAGPDGHVMIVEIDPADVCSVPHDCGHQKLRCCHYTVKSELADRNVPLSDTTTEPAYISPVPLSDSDNDGDDEDFIDGYDDGYDDGLNGLPPVAGLIEGPYKDGYVDGFSEGLRGEDGVNG